MPIDINRGTSGLVLPAEVSNEIWTNTANGSAVMQHATQVTLPGTGSVIPVVTGDPEAQWVSETDESPVSRPSFSSKQMRAHKLSVIVPFSKEFTRDAATLYGELVRRLPEALAAKFDSTVLHGGQTLANFDNLSGAEVVALGTDAFAGLVEADTAVGVAGGLVNGYVLAPQGRGLILGSVDSAGRPLFVANANEGVVSSLLGSPVSYSRAVFKEDTVADADVVGVAGDWSGARYGVVEGVQISVSDQATINDNGTEINLWQRDMVAVKAQIEVGFVVRDASRFVRLTK